MKQEDEEQEEAKKKDEAQKAEKAMARGDILDVGEDVPMVDNQEALSKHCDHCNHTSHWAG